VKYKRKQKKRDMLLVAMSLPVIVLDSPYHASTNQRVARESHCSQYYPKSLGHLDAMSSFLILLETSLLLSSLLLKLLQVLGTQIVFFFFLFKILLFFLILSLATSFIVTTFLPFVASAYSGPINTLLFSKLIVFLGRFFK